MTQESLVGRRVAERYHVKGVLLRSRYSTLYSARDENDGLPIVVQHVIAMPSAARFEFVAAARQTQHLQHRNLARVLDALAEDDDIFLIHEPYDGHALDYVVKNLPGPPQEPLLARWMEQIASALDYLHRQEPPHTYRFLRPQSVMLTKQAVIKLVDIGLGVAPDLERQGGATPFLAPEQMSGTAGPSADLYALGALFYALATGERPPLVTDRLRELPGVRRLNPNLTPEFESIIMQLLSLDPHDRPASAAEVVHYLAPHTVPREAPAAHQAEAEQAPGEASPFRDSDTKLPAAPAEPAGSSQKWRAPLEFLWPGKKKPKDDGQKGGAVHDIEMAGVPYLDLGTLQLEREVGRFIPRSIAKRIGGVCIAHDAARRQVTLAVKAPDPYIYDHIAYSTQGSYKPVLMRSDPKLVDLAYEWTYKLSPRLQHVPWLEWLEKKRFHGLDISVIQNEDQAALLQSDDVKGPAVEAVDRMIKEAISIRASDIHIETYETEVVLRYRIDGILHIMDTWPRKQAAAFVKRIKIMSNMDIAQDMMPQGGRITVKVSDQEFDLRVSCLPVPDGESLVLRLLNKGTFTLRLQDLGFEDRLLTQYRRLIDQPHGMLLISGPTGSGKSTTLYATLAEINRPDRKILTVEDPIEYKMSGIIQVQVNTAPREEEKRLTFPKALREFLRHDPDVILVGEIRDDETAAVSVQAALTGHLVLSTIHTNDAVGIVTRMRDRGIETFLIADILIGGIAQRLVRRICANCRREVSVPPSVQALLEREQIPEPRMFVGAGCLQCHRTGYRGRIALYEIMEVSPEIRELIATNANGQQLQHLAEKQGMQTLLRSGLERVADGTVSFDEVKRVCMSL